MKTVRSQYSPGFPPDSTGLSTGSTPYS